MIGPLIKPHCTQPGYNNCLANCACPSENKCGTTCCRSPGINVLVCASPQRNLCCNYQTPVDCGGTCCTSKQCCNGVCCGDNTVCLNGQCGNPSPGTKEFCLLSSEGGTGVMCTTSSDCDVLGVGEFACSRTHCCVLRGPS